MGKIIVKINMKTGATKVSAEGYPGSSCLAKTASFERALGKTVDDQPTDEAYADEQQDQTQEQSN